MSRKRKISAKVMPVLDPHDYWASVTDVPCPSCEGTVRWAEAGYVPGYRICDGCGQHWLAAGDIQRPVLSPVTEIEPGCYGPAPEGEAVDAGQPYRWA